MAKQPRDLAERQASKHQRRLLTCKHFNGAIGPRGKEKACRAGVEYRKHVGGDDFGWLLALPCLPKEVGEDRRREVVPCALREFPTEAEVEAEEKEIERSCTLICQAITLCREDAGGKRGIVGYIACPACGGSLQYSVSSYNGHVHGRCGTSGCLAWAQ